MKKIIKGIELIAPSLIIVLLSYNFSSAASVVVTNPIGTDDFTTLVSNFLQWLLSIAGGLALLMLIFGGVVYVTSAGDQQKAAQGKRIVTWTVLGLVVILMSFAIVKLMEDIFVN